MENRHVRRLCVLGAATLATALALSATGVAGAFVRARAASTAGTATFVLDHVSLTLSSPMLPGRPFVTSKAESASQVASSSILNPYREAVVTAVPFGTSPGTERLPDAHAGDRQSYQASLASDRASQGAHPAAGPDASLFGQETSSVVSVLYLHLDGPQLEPTVIVEWVAQAGPRTWILRISEELTPEEDPNQVVDSLSGVTLTSSDLNRPSTLPSPSPQAQTSPTAGPVPSPTLAPTPMVTPTKPAPTPTRAVTQSLVRPATAVEQSTQSAAPAPGWWNETCDAGNHPGSYSLGSSYDGVLACGPLPIDGGTNYLVRFYGGAWGEYEWQCVELAMRYLYLVDGVGPYSANGSQVVWDYTGTALRQIGNGTAYEAPVPGAILSYGSTSTSGHTSVVSSVSVNSAGNGTITVVEQDDTTNGTTTMQVSNWVVQGNPYPVSGWLQAPSSSAPAPPATDSSEWVATNSNGTLEALLRGDDGQFWTDFQTRAGSNASWSGWYPMGGAGPGEPAVVLDGQGRLELFVRGVDGQLWHDYETQAGNPASWSGFSALGGYLARDPVATVLANGAVDVYAVGGDGALWHDYETVAGSVSSWSGWHSLGGLSPGEPAPIVESGGRVDLFVQGVDDQLWQKYQTVAGSEQSWSAWYPLGGILPGPPAPVLESDGRVDVFVRGQDAQLWHQYQTAAGNERGWSGWQVLGGLSPLDPVVGRNSNGRLEMLVVGIDGQPWHDYQTVAAGSGSWSGWGPLGGLSSSPLALGVSATRGLQVFLVGRDTALWFDYQATPGSSSSWAGWYSLGGGFPSP